MSIRLIALDVDGTLLDPDGRLRPAVRAAVRRAAARGVRVALVTGRRILPTLPVVAELGLPVFVLGCHGAVAVDPEGRALWQDGIPVPAARAAAALAAELGLAPFVYVRYRQRGQVREELRHPPAVDPPVWRWFPPQDPCLRCTPDPVGRACRPIRITVVGEPDAVRRYRERLRQRLAGRLDLFAPDDPFHGQLVVEVLPPGTHKARGLARLVRRLGIPRQRVLAIGDYLNDVEMLRWAGIGVAMGNAPEPVRRAADWVTAPNDADGVAVALDRFVLGVRAEAAS